MAVALSSIVVDAGTQVRAAINEAVVSDYAERMTDGVAFPPVVLVHDGNQYYLADGFHRVLAAKRNGYRDIDAEVHAGTRADALWFALGANKTNGQRLTPADKKHAILLALQTWPERSINQIAEQIGVNQRYASEIKKEVSATTNLPDRVTGKDGKSYPAARQARPGRALNRTGKLDTSRAAIEGRRTTIREMAAAAYTSHQVAAKLGISEEGCRAIAREIGVEFHADRALHRSRRHDATRIIEMIVMDAEHLTADVNLIDFATLDGRRLPEWIESLVKSRRALDAFIKRLLKEKETHGEAA